MLENGYMMMGKCYSQGDGRKTKWKMGMEMGAREGK